jgi:hypothetical protein
LFGGQFIAGNGCDRDGHVLQALLATLRSNNNVS